MNNNPLSQYFRQPAIYVRLPSGGQGWADGSLTVTPDGEYPVLPMTTRDEITYRTPDALFNGQAVVSVIQSCMPNILDAWAMPSADIDTVLIAIRIATYGHEMDITTQCPQCQEQQDYGVDLRRIMEKITAPDTAKPLVIGDLRLHFRSLTYREANNSSLDQFADQKALQNLDAQQLTDEERAQRLGQLLLKLTDITAQLLARSISEIETPQVTVTDQQQIQEWLLNCDVAVFDRVRDHVIKNKQQAEIAPLQLTCQSCQHAYTQPFTLDQSNFFGAAS